MSVLEKVRQWIDGESAELVLEQAARDAQVKPRSHSEEFIVKIARAVEDVMQREMVPLPQGTTIIPTEYTIFLSDEDDKDWQGIKRKGLEQGLYHILAERAKEISGKKKLETKTFVVELRVDGTLSKGDIRVQHSWEDSSSGKTGVLARPKSAPLNLPANHPTEAYQSSNNAPPPVHNRSNQYSNVPQSPNFTQQSNYGNNQNPPTVRDFNVSQAIPVQGDADEEMTHVQKKNVELYRLEVWRGGVRQSVIPIYQTEISIGRGSKSKPVDITLSGDPEISRRHITLMTDGAGNFSMISEGRNPAMINNYEMPNNQRVAVTAGVPISVCSFQIRIQPR